MRACQKNANGLASSEKCFAGNTIDVWPYSNPIIITEIRACEGHEGGGGQFILTKILFSP